MKIKFTNRHSLSALIIVFYLIPLLFFSAYSIHLMAPHKSWTLLSLGLLLIAFSTLVLILLLFYWEQSVQNKTQTHSFVFNPQTLSYSSKEKEDKVTSLDLDLTFNHLPSEPQEVLEIKESSKDQQEELMKTLEMKTQELEEQEEANKQSQLKVQQISQDFADYKLFSEEQLKQKQLQLTSLQQIIEDQRNEMEKRQEQIHQLDTKIHDLSYEIKTLLYLHEEEESIDSVGMVREEKPRLFIHEEISSEFQAQEQVKVPLTELSDEDSVESPIHTSSEATNLLKKCIQIAQKLTGAHYYSNESSRYREFSSSYFAIDQRRLFESLRSEMGALIIVYSQKENKVLFANNESKAILGWNPDKFVVDFNLIMEDGMSEWKNALHLMTTTFDAQVRLLAKSKQGQELLLNCHLGKIPSGLFRNYIIGILYPT